MRGKMVGLVTALLVAMLALGLSYALWFTTLSISGTINTGIVRAEIIAGECYDDEPEEKDVSGISCYVDENGVLVVTVSNAYPCIEYTCEFNVTNTGTIPVKVQSITISPEEMADWVTVNGISVGDQIEPGETVECSLIVHLTNDADQGETYTFTVEILLVQWNEYE
ncbi:MAG: hypothetical protein QXR62_04155 [Candidatus Bathyarchaeia archaeon]